ncbi:MAG: anti-sigma factor, partial [Afipia sp.]
MNYSEDHIALAAEYALGTLSADERALVETMMIVDHGFMEVVDAWDRKLSPLHQMVAPIEPPAHLWDNISAALGLVGPQPEPVAEPKEEPKPEEPVVAEQPEQAPTIAEQTVQPEQPVVAAASTDAPAEPGAATVSSEIVPEP